MTSVVGLTEILTVTVTPTPGSVQDTNLTKVAGTAVATGTGASDAGTQRVVLSSDSSISGSVSVSNFPATQPVSGSVSVSNFPATQPVSGTVTANAGTGNFTVAQATASNLNATVTGTVSTKTALTANSPTFATVGVTSAQALASNASRKGLILINTSTGNISLGFGVAAVLNSGITLYPNGTFFMDEYMYTTAAVNAIAANASSNLAIQEWQ